MLGHPAVPGAAVREAPAVGAVESGVGPQVVLEAGIGIVPGSLLALLWVVSGLTGALLLRRRGHDLHSLAGLAVVLGPLFLPLAVHLVRWREPATRPIPIAPGGDRSGRHVVVVLLGPPETAADALPMLRQIDLLGSVTLVALIDFESAQRKEWDDTKSDAARRLQRAAVLLDDFEPAQVLVPGTLTTGVSMLGLDSDDLVLIVGDAVTPGAERLSSRTKVPVVSMPATSDPG